MKRIERNTNTSLMNESPMNEPYKDEKQPYKTNHSSPTRQTNAFPPTSIGMFEECSSRKSPEELETNAPRTCGSKNDELYISEGISSIRS